VLAIVIPRTARKIRAGPRGHKPAGPVAGARVSAFIDETFHDEHAITPALAAVLREPAQRQRERLRGEIVMTLARDQKQEAAVVDDQPETARPLAQVPLRLRSGTLAADPLLARLEMRRRAAESKQSAKVSVALYIDVHVLRAITRASRVKGGDGLTAQEDGTAQLEDRPLLDHAGTMGQVLFTRDEESFIAANGRQQRGEPFAGVIYGHQLPAGIGQCIADLELIAKAGEPSDFANRVWHLPFR
jgi:hypothetical protein